MTDNTDETDDNIPNIIYNDGKFMVQNIHFVNCGVRLNADGQVEAIVGFDNDDNGAAIIMFERYKSGE